MYLAYKVLTTIFLIFAGCFFVCYAWRNRKDKPHFIGNAISSFFLLSAVYLMWYGR